MVKISIFHFKTALCLVIFLFFSSVTVALWQNHNKYEYETLLRFTETAAEQIRIRMEGMMNSHMASLDLLAQRWIERTPPDFSRKRFLEFAEAFYSHYPGFYGINWIDPDGMIEWVFPAEINAGARDKNVHHHQDSRYRRTFARAQKTLEYAATPCLEIHPGGIGFDTFWPLIYGSEIQGYLNGVFQVQHIMDICLAQDILKNFCVLLYEDGQLIYINEKQHQHQNEPKREKYQVLREICFPGKTWQIHLEPRPSVFKSSNILNLLYLFFGLTLSGLLALLFYFLVQRLEMYREVRDHALLEVGERKQAEAALRENEKRLQNLLEELDAKNTELETFVYSISHDLKTPIVTIKGFIGAMQEDFGNYIPANAQTYFQYIKEASTNMELLINDLLALSRIGRVGENNTSLPFQEVMAAALRTLGPQIEAKGVVVNVQENFPVVYGEKQRLIQVMENLLSNAIKYIGKNNPAPQVSVGFQKQKGRDVFFVKDNGIGIQERYYKKIFQVFQRLPDAKKTGEGTGIGLAIVKRIIEHHGGQVWVSSEHGKGSTFFFTLNKSEA